MIEHNSVPFERNPKLTGGREPRRHGNDIYEEANGIGNVLAGQELFRVLLRETTLNPGQQDSSFLKDSNSLSLCAC